MYIYFNMNDPCCLSQEVEKKCTYADVLTQRSFGTRAVYCFSSLRGRPLDTTDQLGLTDMGLRALRRMVWPAGDRHSGCDWSKIRVLVDGANRA